MGLIPMVGFYFWGVLVVKELPKSGKHKKFQCLCPCGNTFIVLGYSLRNGNTRSCGCYKKKRVSEAHSTHGAKLGGKETVEYRAWTAMLQRCRNSKYPYYHRYGGRGIKVCDRWLDYANFIEDMGPRPSPNHSLDRKDNDGDYSPENCKWSTQIEQSNNRWNTIFIEYDGRVQTLANWARELQIQRRTLRARFEAGWTIEKAFSKK